MFYSIRNSYKIKYDLQNGLQYRGEAQKDKDMYVHMYIVEIKLPHDSPNLQVPYN